MSLTAFPIQTTPAAANLIANTPQGPVTATDVQAAINQLVSLIPSPGTGSDPLALVNGLTGRGVNASVLNDANDAVFMDVRNVTDSSTTNPNFSDENLIQLGLTATNGQATNGGLTTAKKTFIPLNISGNYNASGQKFGLGITINAYGMSDAAAYSNINVNYAGGPVNGDEGQCWGVVSDFRQQTFLNTTTITSVPTPSTINTTTTQSITGSKSAQTVTVASSSGASVNDWVIVEQQLPNGSPNLEAVKLTAVGPGTITGIFMYNHNNGVTVKPALRLIVVSSFQMGQDRVLVNLSQPSYSTGTVTTSAPFTSPTFTGTGTVWTNSIVGGNALNIGAIALATDDYTGSPFDSGANRLKSWHQIASVASNTSLNIWSFSVAGDQTYKGNGGTNVAYVIRPCVRVLRIIAPAGGYTGEIICENSTSTWSPGDSVEQAICPYPDVTGFQWHMEAWTAGGTYRHFTRIKNDGARAFSTCFNIVTEGGVGSGTGANGADLYGWGDCIQINSTCLTALNMRCYGSSTQAAVRLYSTFQDGGVTDQSGQILWGSGTDGAYIRPNSSVLGLNINTNLGGGTSGLLAFTAPGQTGNPSGDRSKLAWPGNIALGGATGVVSGGTINRACGSMIITAGTSSGTINNNLVSSTSIVLATIQSNDATAVIKNCTPGAGSFTVRFTANCTADTTVCFLVINPF